MNRNGIAIGGNIVFDYVKIIDSYPKQGNLSTILSIQRSVGGALPNTLIDLAKMDGDIPLEGIGVAGCDEPGDFVIDLLKKHGINTDMIIRQDKLGTSFTDVMTVQSTGDRTFFHFRGANSLLDISHFDFNRIKADILHVGYALLLDKLDAYDPEYGTVLAHTFFLAQCSGMKTSLDVVSENSDRFSKIVPPSLKYTDYCTINEVEASLITGIPARDKDEKLILDNMKPICTRLKQMGIGHWAVVHAPEGAFALDDSNDFYIQPSLELPAGYIKGTVGAGDAFCAGVLYCIYKGWDIKKALQIGTAAAASCLSEPGSTDGMRDIDSMEKLFMTMPRRKL
ncbi:MAG: hypothetical protein PWP55_282 [Clostridiales bacterium]|uniref:PfkB domain protein n=2 Tax=Mahella TaxID=252965 RepID=F4A1T5_MAHA5|nr:PfkB domain protein [Mahella australiensis 50-1 BON]MDI3508090.1 hypothetical protein [Clostridiales bacterium]